MLSMSLVGSSPIDTYTRGKELFDASYFEQAAPLLSLFVEDPGNASATTIISARWMLAQAKFFTHDEKGAAKQVRWLIKQKAETPPDLPPGFEAFVNNLRAATPAPTPPTPPKPKPKENDKPGKPPPVEPSARQLPVETPPSPNAPIDVQPDARPTESTEITAPEALQPMPAWYLRGLPGGVGHLIAKDYIGGSVFMMLTVLSAAANITFLVINARALGPDGTLPATPAYPGLYIAQHVSAGVFYGILAASLIDGIAFVPSRVADKWAPP